MKTFSNENDIVLDPFGGSGTVGIVCKNQKRNFIIIEKKTQYFELANSRIIEHKPNIF